MKESFYTKLVDTYLCNGTIRFFKIYLAVLGLSCSIQAPESTDSVAMALGLSCPKPCEISVHEPEIEPMSPASHGRSLTLGPWAKCLRAIRFFEVVQFSSVTQSCLTLCNPMNCSTPGLPVRHQLPEYTQTHVHQVGDAIQPSHPLSSPFPPAPNPSQHQIRSKESTLHMRWPKYWSFSFSIILSKEHPGLINMPWTGIKDSCCCLLLY